MLRSVIAAGSLACALAGPGWTAELWPGQIGEFQKVSSTPLAVSDTKLWQEYGLKTAQQADYASAKDKFHGEVYQLGDPTGALGAFDWQRPADARPSKLAELAVQTRDGVLLVYGNYLFRLSGWIPKQEEELHPLFAYVPNADLSALPTLGTHIPVENVVPNSERYILGPESLARFVPGVPPSAAGFSMGGEGQVARFQTKAGPMDLAVFSYPTPQIAALQLTEFQKLPAVRAKRAGPLVAVVLKPADADAAELLLAGVKYNATITMNERIPTRRDNIGDLVVNAFILVGILIGLFVIAGILFGFLKRWFGWGTAGEAMIVLHLEDR